MLLADFLKTEQQEQITILISYGEKEQLPRVPAADSSTGEEQAVAVYECLQISTPQLHSIQHRKAQVTILEQMLARELLYIACRHHILEIILRGVF